jgi:hypothetical protein
MVFATVAGQPPVRELSWFEHNPLVLRDLAPEIVLASTNIIDDIELCLKADTSPHLAEQLTGNRDFLTGTLDDVMAGRVSVPTTGPWSSPFGLGVLDLAFGENVYDELLRSGELHTIDDFFHDLRRHGPAAKCRPSSETRKSRSVT